MGVKSMKSSDMDEKEEQASLELAACLKVPYNKLLHFF